MALLTRPVIGVSLTGASEPGVFTRGRIGTFVGAMLPDEELCSTHGWPLRQAKPEVWDAVLFTTELDLLDIRWNELDPVVDKFFILENNGALPAAPRIQRR